MGFHDTKEKYWLSIIILYP